MAETTALALLLTSVMGIVLGALGGGGSILSAPIFIYVLGIDPKTAIAMSLPVVGLTSMVGAWGHSRSGHLHVRQALLFGTLAMIGSYAGARLSVFVPSPVQLTVLALLMVGAAISMLRPRPDHGPAGAPPAGRSPLPILGIGLAIGILTGLVGIGGGFLFVPALVVLVGMPMPDAVGTSLLVIAMSATAGLAGYLGRIAIPWHIVLLLMAASSAGILAGVHLVRLIPPRVLQRAFGVFLLLVAGSMLYHTLAPATPASRVTRGPHALPAPSASALDPSATAHRSARKT